MERVIKWFIIVALFYFLIGITLGTAFVTFPSLHSFIDEGPGSLIKWVHGHINLLGWVSMTLFALIYWFVPELTKKPIFSETLSWAHFYLANLGLLGMLIISAVGGYIGGKKFAAGIAENVIYAELTPVLLIDLGFTFIFLIAGLIFIYNILRSLYS